MMRAWRRPRVIDPPYPADVRTRVPKRLRYSLVIGLPDGRIGELTLLWVRLRNWRRRPEASDPEAGWVALRVGAFAVAVRLIW